MRRLLPTAVLLLLPAMAQAHPFDLASLELSARDDVVQAQLECALPVALEAARIPEGADLSPAGVARLLPGLFASTLASGTLTSEGSPCTWGTPDGSVEGIRIRIRAAARCPSPPGTLKLTLPFVEERPPTFRILGVATLGERRLEFQAGPGRETVALEGPPPSASAGLLRGLMLPLHSTLPRLCLLLLLAVPLGATRRAGAGAVGATLTCVALGWLLGRGGVAIAPMLLTAAAVLAVLAALLEPVLARATTRRWGFGAGGVVMGLGLGKMAPGMGALGLLLGLLLAAAIGLTLPRGPPRLVQGLAAAVGIAVVLAVVLPV